MIQVSYGLILSVIIFILGLIGTIIRKNLFFMLLGLEIMINASALAFVIASNYWCQPDGQIMYIVIITFSASEASISLALLLKLYRQKITLDVDAISEMYG